MALGDPRIEVLYQAGKLDESGGGLGRRIIRTVVLYTDLTSLSEGLVQRPRLRGVGHEDIVHNRDS